MFAASPAAALRSTISKLSSSANAVVVDRDAADREQRIAVGVEARGLGVDDDPAPGRCPRARRRSEPAQQRSDAGHPG